MYVRDSATQHLMFSPPPSTGSHLRVGSRKKMAFVHEGSFKIYCDRAGARYFGTPHSLAHQQQQVNVLS